MTLTGMIGDEWLMSYAAGALTEPEALLVATHVSYHPALHSKLADAEALGGALLEKLAPSALSDEALENVLARLDDAVAPQVDAVPAPASVDPDIPRPLREYLGQPLDALRWKMMGPGMKQCRLGDGSGGQKLWLLKAAGGTRIPVHDHRGTEFTLVLRGGYRVRDLHYGPGMLEIASPEVRDHQPLIDDGEECICLVITDAPIRLHSWIGRLIQPFIGL